MTTEDQSNVTEPAPVDPNASTDPNAPPEASETVVPMRPSRNVTSGPTTAPATTTTAQQTYTVRDTPPQSHSEEVIKHLAARGDQARGAETEIAPGLTITVGIRHVYFNLDGEVYAVNVQPPTD